MFLRYIGVIVLSSICGGIIYYNAVKIAYSYGFISLSGGFITYGDDKTLDLLIAGFLGIVSGFVISLVVVMVTEIFLKPNKTKLFLVALSVGIINSILYVGLELSDAQRGGISTMNEFEQKLILTTIILQFIIGLLIGIASVLLTKFLILNQKSE